MFTSYIFFIYKVYYFNNILLYTNLYKRKIIKNTNLTKNA